MIVAALNGHVEAVRFLLAAGADIDGRNWHGRTALIGAATNGKAGVVRVLLNKGSDVNAVDKKGRSAIFYALLGGHTGIVSMLEEAGANFERARDDPRAMKELLRTVKEIDFSASHEDRSGDGNPDSYTISVFLVASRHTIVEFKNVELRGHVKIYTKWSDRCGEKRGLLAYSCDQSIKNWRDIRIPFEQMTNTVDTSYTGYIDIELTLPDGRTIEKSQSTLLP